MGNEYNDMSEDDIRLKTKGIYVSKLTAVLTVATVVALLVAEGLIIGLVNVPECETYAPIPQTTDKPPPPTMPTTTRRTSTTIEPEKGPWTNIRLPSNLIPDKYDVTLRPILEPDAFGRYWFEGSTTVRYWCKEPTTYIIMHSSELNYTMHELNLQTVADGKATPIKSMTFYTPNDFLVVETETPCVKDTHYQFTISSFVARLRSDLDGLYLSDYVNSEGNRVVLATTQMEPDGARKTFPCFDEPAMKANFSITLLHKTSTNYTSISNMPVLRTEIEIIDGERWTSTIFEESVRMSTYLLAMVVCDFKFAEGFTREGIQTRIYARASFVESGYANYAAMAAPDILDFFIDYTRVGYPLAKCDQIGIPDFSAGAMENWGLVTYREAYLMRDDNTTSDVYKIFITSIIAHELAHQWFGNIVSPAWWDYLWLNEGFATYFSYLGENHAQPTWKTMERFVTDDLRSAFSVDSYTSSRPLIRNVETISEINSMFDTISYSKGACVLRMIHGFMGDENFMNGLNEYLNAHAYDVATQDDLFYYWSKHTTGLALPTELSIILETWTLQMGFPVVTVRDRDPITNAFLVTQEYFLIDPDAVPRQTEGSLKYGYQWYIPFTYKKGSNLGGSVRTIWLSPYNSVILDDSDFILGNVGAVGYYRVNYDRDSWERIASRLDSIFYKDIPEESRAQLLDDAFTLASSDRLLITVPLEIALYLHRDDSYIAWVTFMDNIKYFEYMLGRTPVFGTLTSYILELVVPSIYEKYGWNDEDKSDSALIGRRLQEIGIEAACYYGHDDCIENAKQLFSNWMDSPDDWSVIPASFRSDVLCTAIRNGGNNEWNFAWERFGAAVTVSSEWQVSLRYGMACSKDPWILGRYLEYARDPDKIRRQDAVRTMEYVGREEYGRDIAWAFMVDNWSSLVEQYSSGLAFSSLISSITRRFSTEFDLKLLEDFKTSTDNLAGAGPAIEQAMERTKANMQWRNRNEDLLTTWFYENVEEVY